jgi:hypothetical protein
MLQNFKNAPKQLSFQSHKYINDTHYLHAILPINAHDVHRLAYLIDDEFG